MTRAKPNSPSVKNIHTIAYSANPELLLHARIPKLYWNATLDPKQSAHCFNFGLNLKANIEKGYGLLLMGPNGTGKTFSATALLRAAIPFTRKVLYITAPDLIQAFIHERKFDDDMLMARAAENRDLLVIDDLAQEYRGSGSGFSEQQLINLIRVRVTQRRSIIITTNLEWAGIEQIYTPTMRSLLSEGCIAIEMKGEDLRRDSTRRLAMAKDAGVER